MSDEQIIADEPVVEEAAEETVEESAEETTEEEVSEDTTEETEEETVEEVPELPKEVELNLFGKKTKLPIEEVINLAEKSGGAQKRFDEAAKQREELLNVINDLKNPDRVMPLLEKMGHNPRKMAEDLIYEQMELEKMTDAEKETLRIKKENDAYKRKEQESVKEKEQRMVIESQEKARAEFDETFTSALSEVDIPKTDESVAKMAFYMESALNNGQEISAKDAALLVQDDLSSNYKKMGKDLPVEDLVKLFGESIITKIKNYDLSKIKSPLDGNKVDKDTPQQSSPKKGRKKRTWEQLQEELDAITGSPGI